MTDFYRNFLLPVGLLAGTIIGAGVFALPFIFSVAGLTVGFFYLALAALIYVIIHLFYADVLMRTPGEHRFVGLLARYLGRPAQWLGVVLAVAEMILVLVIYLILAISFINLVWPESLDLVKLLVFWAAASSTVFLSLKKITFLEFLVTWGMMAIIFVIFILGVGNFERLNQINLFGGWGNFFLPLGPILFALGGRVAIPSVVNYFKLKDVDHHRILVTRTIIAGTLAPAAVYALFVVGVLGLAPAITPDAVSGLIGQVPPAVLMAIGIFGILALWSSYIVVGLDVDSILRYDLKFPRGWSATAVVLAPLVLYFASSRNFIALVSLVGGLFLSLEGIFIAAMWAKAHHQNQSRPGLIKGCHPLLAALAFLVFAAALAYEVFKLVSY